MPRNSLRGDADGASIMEGEKMGIFERIFGKKGETAEEWFRAGLGEKDLEKKVEYYTKAIELDPKHVLAWREKASNLYVLRRYEEAVRCYDEVLKLDPKYIYAYGIKGLALYDLRRYEEAIRCFDKVLEINPNQEKAKSMRRLAEEKLRERRL